MLAAGGGAGRERAASFAEVGVSVTVTVRGEAPEVMPLAFLLPAIRTSATLPLEQYPADEQAATQ